MSKWFRQSLTDDQDSFDPILIAIFMASFLCIAITGYDFFIKNHTPDLQSFGIAIASILGAGGAGYGAKRFGDKRGNTDSST